VVLEQIPNIYGYTRDVKVSNGGISALRESFAIRLVDAVCIPAAVGVYSVRPIGAAVGTACATLRVTVRVS
jgi:hypothetical protein